MSSDPFGTQNQQPRRRGMGFGGMRWWVLILFAGYAGYYYFSNRTVDPYTGEKVLIDKSLSAEDESALGLQAYKEILSQEQPVDPSSDIARQIGSIAQRLIARVDEVEPTLPPSVAKRRRTSRPTSTGRSTSSSPSRPMRSPCQAERWRSTRGWCQWRRTRTAWRW